LNDAGAWVFGVVAGCGCHGDGSDGAEVVFRVVVEVGEKVEFVGVGEGLCADAPEVRGQPIRGRRVQNRVQRRVLRIRRALGHAH